MEWLGAVVPYEAEFRGGVLRHEKCVVAWWSGWRHGGNRREESIHASLEHTHEQILQILETVCFVLGWFWFFHQDGYFTQEIAHALKRNIENYGILESIIEKLGIRLD